MIPHILLLTLADFSPVCSLACTFSRVCVLTSFFFLLPSGPFLCLSNVSGRLRQNMKARFNAASFPECLENLEHFNRPSMG